MARSTIRFVKDLSLIGIAVARPACATNRLANATGNKKTRFIMLSGNVKVRMPARQLERSACTSIPETVLFYSRDFWLKRERGA
jgi:hypothetical protein